MNQQDTHQQDVLPTVRDLYEALARPLGLEILGGANGLSNTISSPRIQKLGLALAGYTDYLHEGRVQVVGRTEINYLKMLAEEERGRAFERIFQHRLCCILVTKDLEAPPGLVEQCRQFATPLLRTPLLSSTAIDAVTGFLEERLAASTSLHGVLMEVFGLGVLLLGESGVGKSECALDLILRGHRLVSDDLVRIKKHGTDRLVGSGPEQLQFHMELRGLGIINIRDLFGISAVSPSKEIDLIIELVRWNSAQEYDRLGLEESRYPLLEVSLPHVTMPVASGRNLATLVEVAVRIEMLRKQGYHPSREFIRDLEERLRIPVR